ncbi:hypothetical protein NUW58_g3380 [Xylaria curta]|uniref:Uncharacterized protein n=1 Tax=Xylaria curta TaxID=42375 RepID=A0ACC1PB94_9PEZI|nr:hypothetical protein NUW58_g3380 [Xylaria curta]
MPPAISDDEASDLGDIDVPISTTKRAASDVNNKPALSHDDHDDDDNEMLDVVGDDDNKDDQNEEGDDDEELDEDEYIVEKILAHVLEADGSLKYKVKWEGYEKKSDQTWEEEGNLRENAAAVLDEYLESVGGRDKIHAKALVPLMEDELIVGIAKKHGKEPSQILLRWATQRGLAVIPKTTRQAVMAQNLDCTSFDLSQEDIEQISAKDVGSIRFNQPSNYFETDKFWIFG